MGQCFALDQAGPQLADLQNASTEEELRTVSMAWERELLTRASMCRQAPSLPQVLAEEMALPSLIEAHKQQLMELHQALVAAQLRVVELSTAALSATHEAGQWSSPLGPLRSAEESDRIESANADTHHATVQMASLLDQVLAVQLELDALQKRQNAIPDLRAQAVALLKDTTDVAVATENERDWQYVFASNMSEVSPEDPDNELMSRMQAREDAGIFDCDTFVVHVLEEAGYDLDAVIVVEGQRTTVRRFVMLHAETILRDELQITTNAQGEQQSALSARGRRKELAKLVNDDDARMEGVVTALTLSGQGSKIADKNELRPGDLMQYWYRKGPGEAGGHAVLVHKVRTRQGVLDDSSEAVDRSFKVTGVGVLSAHSAREGEPDVYTKGFVDPDRSYSLGWSAVRPSGSPWPI